MDKYKRVVLNITCPLCNEISTIILDGDLCQKYLLYEENNGLIQDYLPELSEDIREIIQSGVCVKCQFYVFGE